MDTLTQRFEAKLTQDGAIQYGVLVTTPLEMSDSDRAIYTQGYLTAVAHNADVNLYNCTWYKGIA